VSEHEEHAPQAIEDAYFDWLCGEALGTRPYRNVCAYLHSVKFKYDVPNDDNRAADGQELRHEFEENALPWYAYYTNDWMDFEMVDATIFEVLVAMARRCQFQVELEQHEWFYTFLKNLRINRYIDEGFCQRDRVAVQKKIGPFNNRTYSPSGAGSIFPLRRSRDRDMRRIELWYQMSAYIIENQMLS
jgi:hypothetical protein